MTLLSSRSEPHASPIRVFGLGSPATFLAATLAIAAGCAAHSPSPVVEGAPRRPDGVAIDPPMQPPAPREHANATDGLVSLRTPLGAEAARAVVMRFFQVVVNEDREGLRSLLSPSALSVNPTSNARESAIAFWSRRFDSLDYQMLTGGSLFREDGVELYRSDQWDRGALGDDTEASDMIAHVRVPPMGTGRPLLGESITFQLRRIDNRFVISKLTEEFTLP